MRELKKSFWDFITILGATFLSVPLMVVSEMLQARYLGPSNYGKVALVLSAISLLYLFGLSWLRVSIVRFGKKEFLIHGNVRKTTTSFLVNNVFSFFVVTILFYIFRNSIFNFLEIKQPTTFWVILFGCLLAIFKNFVFEILKVIRLIKIQVFLQRLVGKVVIFLGMLLFVFNIFNKDINVNYIITIFLISDLSIVICGFYFIKTNYIFPLIFDKNLLKKMIIYSYPLFFVAWSSYVVQWIDTYVIKYYMDLKHVGIYQAAYKIFETLNSFLGAGIVTITYPIIMVFKTKNQTQKIKNLYISRLIPQFSFFCMFLVSIIIISSDIIFNLIYSNEYQGSILPFKILIASQNFTIISSMLTAIILSYDMTKMLSLIGIFAGFLNIIFDIILVEKFGMTGASVASLFVFSLVPIYHFYYVNKKFKIKKKMALLFPFVTVFIMLINISNLSYIIRISISTFILICIIIFTKNFNLFKRNDLELIQNINMPNFIKKIISNLYFILSKE